MPGSLQPRAWARHTLAIHSPLRPGRTHGSAGGLHPASRPRPSQTGDTEPRSGALSTSATRKARTAKVRSGARPLTSLPPASRNAPRQPCLSTRRGSAGRAFRCLPEGSASGGIPGADSCGASGSCETPAPRDGRDSVCHDRCFQRRISRCPSTVQHIGAKKKGELAGAAALLSQPGSTEKASNSDRKPGPTGAELRSR